MKHILLLLLSVNALYAQDLIYLKNKTAPVNAKVIEINSTEVKYKLPSDSFPILYFLKIEVLRIELSNGVVLEIDKTENLDINKRVGSVKIGLFSPFFDHTNIGYEGYINPNRSWLVSAGIIGLGRQMEDDEKPEGGYLKLGYKWISSKKVNPNIQPTKMLSGFFIQPEITYGQYTIYYDDKKVSSYHYNGSSYPFYYYTYEYIPVEPKKIKYGTAMINVGYQAVSAGGLTLEMNLGLGCYLYSQREVESFN